MTKKATRSKGTRPVKGTSPQNKAQRQKKFLAHYARCGNITAATQAAGVDRSQHYLWMREERYRAKFEQAVEEASDALEAEARRRGMEGVEEPVFYQGEEVARVRRYSDTLLIFLLKAVRPEKFRERGSLELTGRGGGPIQTESGIDRQMQALMQDPELRREAGDLAMKLAEKIQGQHQEP